MLDGLFDDRWQVAAPAVFHQNIENPGISVDVSVVVSHNVIVMQIFQDISVTPSVNRKAEKSFTHTLLPRFVSYHVHSFAQSWALYVQISDQLDANRTRDNYVAQTKLTKPSDFRLTLRMIPKEPLPIMSKDSYKARKEDAIVKVRGLAEG